MPFKADLTTTPKLWDYIVGDPIRDMSIMVDRWYYLMPLSYKYGKDLKVAFKDPYSGAWTPWKEFPGHGENLFRCEKRDGYKVIHYAGLEPAIDVHRSVFENEIVIESDYPDYVDNWKASKIVGAILESKGFEPLYYYSGNKSIHIHVFLDWSCLNDIEQHIQEQIILHFKQNKAKFRKAFIEWLRAKMITAWDTQVREFDTDLIRATHLIRCELSKNKIGFKTFLGYSYKDMPPIPYVCNEDNRIYPSLGKMKLSRPHKIQEIAEEFLAHAQGQDRKQRAIRKNQKLSNWFDTGPEKLRGCIRAILSDDFKAVGDGTSRAMFILVNELRRVYGDDVARTMINDWNARMGYPIKRDADIEYRFKIKMYTLTCTYIHDFLKGLGFDVSEKCKGKV